MFRRQWCGGGALCSVSSVRKIITKMKIDGRLSGTRKSTGGATVSWTGVIHRSSIDTLSRLFSGSTDTAHVHGDVATSNDTTTFADATVSRLHAETSFDTVKAVRYRLPRSHNNWPVAGSIVRVTRVHATVTKNGKTASKDFTHTIVIISRRTPTATSRSRSTARRAS